MSSSWASLNYCSSAPELDEAGKAAMREKAQGYIDTDSEVHARFSDEWVADRVRMLSRGDLDHEGICCAGRDRIMRLSLKARELQEAIREACSDIGCFGNFDEACVLTDEPKDTWCAPCKLSTYLGSTASGGDGNV